MDTKEKLEDAVEYKEAFEDRPNGVFPKAEFHPLQMRDTLGSIECTTVEMEDIEWLQETVEKFVVASMHGGVCVEIYE